MKFIPGFPNLVSNRFRSSIIKSRGGPPSLYCPLYTYLHVGTPRKPEQTRRLKGFMYNTRQERKGVIVIFHHIFGTFNMGCSEGLGAF